MDFKESNTYKNLQIAYEGEVKASGKYGLYAQIARDDGFQQIGNIFDETSHNEKEHGELWLRLMRGGEFPDTLENLTDSYMRERYEWENMYVTFAKAAEEEGYKQIAEMFRKVADIEHHHDLRFKSLADNIKNSNVFCKTSRTVWICINCGNLYYGECAPIECPVCGYPQAYYQINCENY